MLLGSGGEGPGGRAANPAATAPPQLDAGPAITAWFIIVEGHTIAAYIHREGRALFVEGDGPGEIVADMLTGAALFFGLVGSAAIIESP